MTLVYNETQKKAKNMQSKKMIGNVRNKFATIFRRSVLFMRNIAFCFLFSIWCLFIIFAALFLLLLRLMLGRVQVYFPWCTAAKWKRAIPCFCLSCDFCLSLFCYVHCVHWFLHSLSLSLLASVSFTESLIAFVPLMGKKAQQTTSHWLIPLSFMHI